MKIFLIVTLFALPLIGAGCKQCVKSHNEMVHHNAWTQMVFTGKTFVPIFYPAYDSLENKCDEYK